jgi:hypothetical protein
VRKDRFVGGHLEAEDFFLFAERGFEGYAEDWIEQHLIHCPECLRKLDLLLLAEAVANSEEDFIPADLAENHTVQPSLSIKRDC